MQQHAGVFRTQAIDGRRRAARSPPCASASTRIALKDKSRVFNTARVEALEVDNLIEAAQATIVSAAARKECRGAHTVSDYERPADDPVAPLGRDDANWMKHTLWYSEGNRLAYKPVKLQAADGRVRAAQGPYVLRSRTTSLRIIHDESAHSRSTATTRTRTPSPTCRPSRSNSTATSACCSTP